MHQQFILLHTEASLIYLEKRPSPGLWGGLWCMPSFDLDTCPMTYFAKHYGLNTALPSPLINIKHTFSHFHLHIQAATLQITHAPELSGSWFKPADLTQLGLAKPVAQIIHAFLKIPVAARLGCGEKEILKKAAVFFAKETK